MHPRSVIHLIGAMAAGVLLFPSNGDAQQPAPTFSLSITEPFELVEDVGTTRRIGRAEIEARNVRTLDEALRLLPGVYVRTGGDGTPRIDIRGFRSRHVLLLVNGVQVNSTVDGQFDPARISTAAIREIKVSYGTSSVLYGDNALAGVIEISTVDGQRDASVDLSAGTSDQWGAAGRFSRTFGRWSFTGAASGYAIKGYRLPGSFVPTSLENGGRRDNSDRDRGDARGSVAYRVSPSTSVSTEWAFGGGGYGVPPGTINDPADIFAQSPRFERVEDYRAASGQVSVTTSPSGWFNLRGWVYRNRQREDRARYDDGSYGSMSNPLVSGTFQSREKTTVTGSTALARIDAGRLGSIRVAVNQRREAFDSDGMIRDVAQSGGGGGGGGGGRGGGGGQQPPTFGVRSFTIDQHVDVYSTGAEWQFRPTAKLGTVVGSSVNWQRRPGSDTAAEPTWIAGVSYQATSTLRFHGSATRKIRVPSIDQLYSTTAGNPALRPETAYGMDVGAEQRIGGASGAGVSVFVTQANDFIERVSGSPFENQDEYRFAGTELTAYTAAIDRVTLRGSYSFLDSDNETAGTANRQLQTRPRHRGTLEWSWKPLPSSEVRGAVQHVGRQFFDSRGSVPVQVPVNAYTLLDLGYTHTITRHVEVALDATNLFDELYEQGYGLPREGRIAVLTVRVRPN